VETQYRRQRLTGTGVYVKRIFLKISH
jgi:hypothetical protein